MTSRRITLNRQQKKQKNNAKPEKRHIVGAVDVVAGPLSRPYWFTKELSEAEIGHYVIIVEIKDYVAAIRRSPPVARFDPLSIS